MKKDQKNKPNLEPKELEDYSPGATKSQVHEALKVVSTTKAEHKRIKKHAEQPDSA